jgi:ATP-dependent Clp protease adaptor protein ClpS
MAAAAVRARRYTPAGGFHARESPHQAAHQGQDQDRAAQLWKVILLNDDYTPREFVVQVLKAVFRMNETQAYKVMITAHQKGACVIAVFTKDVADTKAKEATDLGKQNGYPLYFTTEPEE